MGWKWGSWGGIEQRDKVVGEAYMIRSGRGKGSPEVTDQTGDEGLKGALAVEKWIDFS